MSCGVFFFVKKYMCTHFEQENIKHVNRNNLRNGKLYMNVILKLLKLIQFQHGDHVKYYNY